PVGGALADEGDRGPGGRLPLVQHLAVHRVEAGRVPAAEAGAGPGGGERRQQRIAHHRIPFRRRRSDTRGRPLRRAAGACPPAREPWDDQTTGWLASVLAALKDIQGEEGEANQADRRFNGRTDTGGGGETVNRAAVGGW